MAVSEAQMKQMGGRIQPADILEVDQFKEAVKERLRKTEFNNTWVVGLSMSFERLWTMQWVRYDDDTTTDILEGPRNQTDHFRITKQAGKVENELGNRHPHFTMLNSGCGQSG